MDRDTFLRLVRIERRGTERRVGRSGIARIEVVRDGEVIGELAGVRDAYTRDPLDGISELTVTICNYEEVIEPPEQHVITEQSA